MKRTELVFFTLAAALMLVILAHLAVLLSVIAAEANLSLEAILGLLIGSLLTGLAVLWGLSCYRRAVREATIAETREVLKDVLKNRLTAAVLRLEKHQRRRNETSLEQAKAKLKETAAWVDSFSGATIEEWKHRYEYEEATPGRGETTGPATKRPGDRRWMLRWLSQEKPFRHDRQQLSYPQRLRLLWWGLRGGRKLARFRESIQDRRSLLASYTIARKVARLW